MAISRSIPQLRTTDLTSSIHFYTEKLGLSVEFVYQDFYAAIRAGSSVFHLKLVDEKDPSIAYVDKCDHFHLYLETEDLSAIVARLKENGVPLVKNVHETPWGTREVVFHDDQGHTLYLSEPL